MIHGDKLSLGLVLCDESRKKDKVKEIEVPSGTRDKDSYENKK